MKKVDLFKVYRQKTALIIDDYPDMRGSIRRMLVNIGIERIDTASNGEDAITKCIENDFDIILADYNLGEGKSGQQILEEMRYKRLLKSTSIYMMITAETTKSMVFGALEYQPDDYLAKPFTQPVLQKRLDRLMIEKEALYDINSAIDRLDYDKASEMCQIRIDANDRYQRRCYRLMGFCHFSKHKYGHAKEIYQKVMDERPVEWAEIGLGKSMIALNELDEAEQIFHTLASDGSRCLEVYDCLADIKIRKGDVETAQHLLEEAIEISPNAILRQQKLAQLSEDNQDWDCAEQSYRKVIRLGQNSVYESPEHHFKLARCISSEISFSKVKDKGRQRDVEAVLERVKKKYKNQPEVLLQSGIIQATTYANVGDVDKSKERIAEIQQQVSSASNQSAQLMLDMAKSYKAVGDHEKAQTLLAQLAELHADNDEVCEAIDRISDEPLTKKGKQKAIDLNKEGKDLFGNKDYEKAVALFDQALKHYPNNIGLNLNLMLALVRKMSADGTTQFELDRCVVARDKIAHMDSSSPLFERYQVLCGHLAKMS
jgi:CheY-like chemotaxis protein/uncharacterized membrane-anchored protein YhcB (DUF1043 family)